MQNRPNPATIVYSHGPDGDTASRRVGKKRSRREPTIGASTPWHMRILNALQGRQLFTGIDPDENPGAAKRLAKRRARNKVARASRRINRRR